MGVSGWEEGESTLRLFGVLRVKVLGVRTPRSCGVRKMEGVSGWRGRVWMKVCGFGPGVLGAGFARPDHVVLDVEVHA